jgi:hypothetical protein
MALDISPIDNFKQIRDINEMMQRRNPKKDKKEPEKVFTADDEIELRAIILENTSSTDLTKITDLVKLCKENGFEEENIVATFNKMIQEKVLDTLEKRFVMQLEDSD